eukprot:SAG11_NODE_22259_length_409_cov_0.906452_2_plen_91_part_01
MTRGGEGEFGYGHMQLGLPRCAPWVHPDIVANPILEQLVAAVPPLNPARVHVHRLRPAPCAPCALFLLLRFSSHFIPLASLRLLFPIPPLL